MHEILRCPSCDRKLQLPADQIGKQVRCPNCKNTFTAAADQPRQSKPRPSEPKPDQPEPAPTENDDWEERVRAKKRRPALPKKPAGSSATRIIIGVVVAVGIVGCLITVPVIMLGNRPDKKGPVAFNPPVVGNPPIVGNPPMGQNVPVIVGPQRLAAPVWHKKVFTEGYQVELPGGTKSEMVRNDNFFKDRTVFSFIAHSVTFEDSDLEILTFVLPAPKEKLRSLQQFHDTFQPLLPTKPGEVLGNVTKQTPVEANGKTGTELNFTAGGNQVRYHMYLADRIYIVAAIGSDLNGAKAVIDRCFASINIDGRQPDFGGAAGKPLALDWRKWKDPVSGYEIDMPGKAKTERIGTGPNIERAAVVQVYDPDLDFGVNALRLKRNNLSIAQYLEDAKLDAEDLFKGGKLMNEKKITVDGEEGLELTISTDMAPVICRIVRSPNRDYGFEIYVSGAKVAENRAEVDRFFNSFKFTSRAKK